ELNPLRSQLLFNQQRVVDAVFHKQNSESFSHSLGTDSTAPIVVSRLADFQQCFLAQFCLEWFLFALRSNEAAALQDRPSRLQRGLALAGAKRGFVVQW